MWIRRNPAEGEAPRQHCVTGRTLTSRLGAAKPMCDAKSMRQRAISFLITLCALALAATGAAAQTPVDLELVLAVDVSLSMDLDEQRLQRDGYIAAFRDPEIHKAIGSGGYGRIAVTYVEWAGQLSQQVVIPWTLIDGPAAADSFAADLEQRPISRLRMTSISGAMLFAAAQFEQTPYKGVRRVVDISGDGPNNSGAPVTIAREQLLSKGIAINGLPIMLKQGTRSGFFDISALDAYYRDCVIGGAGAFMVTITDHNEFIPATRRKLLLEIASAATAPPPLLLRTQATGQEEGTTDCMIGERLWQRYMDGRFPN